MNASREDDLHEDYLPLTNRRESNVAVEECADRQPPGFPTGLAGVPGVGIGIAGLPDPNIHTDGLLWLYTAGIGRVRPVCPVGRVQQIEIQGFATDQVQHHFVTPSQAYPTRKTGIVQEHSGPPT